MSREREERELSTADLVSAAEEAPRRQPMPPEMQRPSGAEEVGTESAESRADDPMQVREEATAMGTRPAQGEPLAALFDADLSQDFRTHWSDVQIGFVDDPKRAVQQADELVAQVMKRLAESFARQRAEIEAASGETASTENLRVALRRYRSFFERLLSL